MKKLQLLSFVVMIVTTVTASSSTQTVFNDIEVVGNDLWLAQGATIIKRDKTTGEQMRFTLEDYDRFTSGNVCNIAAKSADDVWFSCSWAGIVHYDGEKFELSNQMGATQTLRCYFVAFDNEGALWASLGYGGFSRLVDGLWVKTYEYEGSEFYAAYHNTGMAFDSNNKMWWTANQSMDGFGYCSPEAGWNAISSENDFYDLYGSYSFNTLAIDSDDNKWLGVKGSQMLKYGAEGNPQLFSLVNVFHDGDNTAPVYDAQVGPDGRIWVAVRNALYAFTGKDDIERVEIPFAESDVRIRSFKHDGDGIWLGTAEHGLFYWHDGQLESVDLSAGVDDVIADVSDDTAAPTYDIMGRRVERTVPGCLYIRAGRKFVAR